MSLKPYHLILSLGLHSALTSCISVMLKFLLHWCGLGYTAKYIPHKRKKVILKKFQALQRYCIHLLHHFDVFLGKTRAFSHVQSFFISY